MRKSFVEFNMEFTKVLTDIECQGIAIDIHELDKLEKELLTEKALLEAELQGMIKELWGDQPINLASSAQLSEFIYSVRFKTPEMKRYWAQSLDLSETNKFRKKSNLRKVQPKDFSALAKACFQTTLKQVGDECGECRGSGRIMRQLKNGKDKDVPCHNCGSTGLLLTPQKAVAGLCYTPKAEWATSNGFGSGKEIIDELLEQRQHPFLAKYARLNAIDSYLSAFIEGIRRGLTGDICHPNFNQCITATGRLSSSNPNWQNMPRESTFRIRDVVVSKHEGGRMLKLDASGLEFRVAGILSYCGKTMEFINNKDDIHKHSAAAIFGKSIDSVTKLERQDAKKYTFRPLYGGGGNTPQEKKWIKRFFELFPGIREWHDSIINTVSNTGRLDLPSGRFYYYRNREAKTQIKNYPVQGFATADIMPLAIMMVYQLLEESGVKARIVGTVHDDLWVDIPENELDTVPKMIYNRLLDINDEIRQRWGIRTFIKLDFEYSIGRSLGQQEDLDL